MRQYPRDQIYGHSQSSKTDAEAQEIMTNHARLMLMCLPNIKPSHQRHHERAITNALPHHCVASHHNGSLNQVLLIYLWIHFPNCFADYRMQ